MEDLGYFGDARLRSRGAALLGAMQARPSCRLQDLARSRSEVVGFGRFLDHSAVSSAEMLTTAARQTAERASGRHVLAIQDTSEFRFPGQEARKRGFGRDGNGTGIGLFLHPTIALDAESGGLLGLVGAQVINRTGGPVADHKTRPAEEKESQRWLAATREAAEVLAAAATVTVVADRESDIYDLFAHRPAGVHLLVRAAQDRALADGGQLGGRIATWPEQDRLRLDLPAQPGRAARTATLALRWGAVALRRPQRAAPGLPDAIPLWVVDVAELTPPAEGEPLHWRLLTTHPVTTPAEARQIIAWYRQRWTIEDLFRSLKSAACSLDTSQLVEARCFTKLATVALIAAVRVLQLAIARDGTTAQPLADAIDPAARPALQVLNQRLEGRTKAQQNPHPTDRLAWLVWIVARLGGWFGYTSRGYRPPGPKTLARGLRRLDAFLDGFAAATQPQTPPSRCRLV